MTSIPVTSEERAGAAAGRLGERLAQGKSAVLVGSRSPAFLGAGLVPVRVDLGTADSPLELGRRLLAAIAHVLGVQAGRWFGPAVAGRTPQTRPPLEERYWGAGLLSALHELAQRAPGRAVVVLEGADEAREDVQNLAAALIARAEALGIPALLTTASPRPSSGPSSGLLVSMIEREGAEALLDPRAGEPVATAVRLEALQQAAAGFAGRTLPEDTRRVLRALATAPRGAPIDALAALVGTSPLAALEALQVARDLGVPVLDAGGGAVTLAPELALALRAELLPSLADGYARHWAGLQRGTRADPNPSEESEPKRTPGSPRESARPQGAATEGAGPSALADATAALLDRMDEATALGLFGEAISMGERALAELEREGEQPGSVRRVQILLRLARTQFLGAGTQSADSGAGGLSLERARALFEAAQAALRPDHPMELACEADVLKAEVLYELGTPEALDAALAALRSAGDRFLKRGQPLRAARLLNEEAAVYVRRGDLAQAQQFLSEARAVFAELDPRRPDVQAEQAQTEHALARLVLHAPESGKTSKSELETALDHAQRAEILYAGLDFDRQLARVHETIGRLECRLGNARRAETALLRAARAQQQRPDPLGLARTAGALGELYAGEKRVGEALGLLARSVQLNAAIGSPRGLAYSRETLGRIAADLGPESSAACSQLLEKIERAELALGQSPASGAATAF